MDARQEKGRALAKRQTDPEGRGSALVRPFPEPERRRVPRERLAANWHVPGPRGAPHEVQAPVGRGIRPDGRGRAGRSATVTGPQGHAKDVPAGLAELQRCPVRREGHGEGSPPRALRWHRDAAASGARPKPTPLCRRGLRDDDEGLHDRQRTTGDDGIEACERRAKCERPPVQHALRLLRQARTDAASYHAGRGERRAARMRRVAFRRRLHGLRHRDVPSLVRPEVRPRDEGARLDQDARHGRNDDERHHGSPRDRWRLQRLAGVSGAGGVDARRGSRWPR